jgi:SAM-dependent methyltransferase
MQDPLEAYLDYLGGHGIPYRLSPELRREEDHDGALLAGATTPVHHRQYGEPPIVEHVDPARGLGSDHATHSVARTLAGFAPELPGRTMLELGCGTGLLAVLGARLGARVVGTDVDARTLELARVNAEANGVRVDLRAGSLCDPIQGADRFDWCVANLPHKPARTPDALPLSQHGGEDGDRLFREALNCLPGRQPPGGRLLFFLHSLPDPRLLARIGSAGYALRLCRWKLRWLQDGEYGALRAEFRRRHEAGRSFLWGAGEREALVCGVWLGTRKDAG